MKYMLTICLALTLVANAVGATVGYWKFEEGSGQTAANEEVATRDLTLRRGTSTSGWTDPEWTVNGVSGNAMHYISDKGVSTEGGRDFLLPNPGVNANLLVLSTFTVEMWVNLDSVPAASWSNTDPYYIVYLGDNGTGSEQNYFMRILNDGSGNAILSVGWHWGASGTSFKEYKHNTTLSVGQWHHIAFSHDSGATSNNTKIWIDGIEQSHNTTAHPYVSQSDPQLIIGAAFKEAATDYRQRSFDGYIDEVRISDIMLATEDLLYPIPPIQKGTLILIE